MTLIDKPFATGVLPPWRSVPFGSMVKAWTR
jgi:hypothetical protein